MQLLFYWEAAFLTGKMMTGTIGITAVNTVATMTEAMTNVMIEGMTAITTDVMIAVVTATGTATTATTIDTCSPAFRAGTTALICRSCEVSPWEFRLEVSLGMSAIG
ncbi:hypothetical protein ABH904_002560 [Pseudomonas frederiksbergensis]